jgi:hypothetical protein
VSLYLQRVHQRKGSLAGAGLAGTVRAVRRRSQEIPAQPDWSSGPRWAILAAARSGLAVAQLPGPAHVLHDAPLAGTAGG